MQVVQSGHASAASNTGPTRDMSANFGAGTLRREQGNTLPIKPARLTLSGFTRPKWGQSAARRDDRGVLPSESKRATILVRAGNSDPSAIGVSTPNWGVAGVGAATPAADIPPALKIVGVMLLGWIAYKHL